MAHLLVRFLDVHHRYNWLGMVSRPRNHTPASGFVIDPQTSDASQNGGVRVRLQAQNEIVPVLVA